MSTALQLALIRAASRALIVGVGAVQQSGLWNVRNTGIIMG